MLASQSGRMHACALQAAHGPRAAGRRAIDERQNSGSCVQPSSALPCAALSLSWAMVLVLVMVMAMNMAGWLAGWEAIPPPSHGRQQRRAVRGPRRKCSASILSFLSSCLAKGTPPRPLSPQQGGGGICCSRAPVCACHHTSQYLHAARCGMCVRFGEFMYVRRAGTRMDGAASSRMTKGDPNSCSRTPRNTGRWPEQEAPTWYFRQLSEKRQGCILRLYSLCRGAVFLLAFPWPALARLETPS